MINIEKLAEELSSLTMIESATLVKHLEEKWGINAMNFAGNAAATVKEEKKIVEQTEFEVILDKVGGKKIQVIKAIREITALGLKESKQIVDEAPTSVKKGIPKKDAESIKSKLEEQGATAIIK